MRIDIYAELYVWNKNADGLRRVLERLQMFGICSKSRFDTLQGDWKNSALS